MNILISRNILAFAIINLFIISSIIPMVNGFYFDTAGENEYLNNLAFFFTDSRGPLRYEYYEKLLQSNILENVEKIELTMSVETQSIKACDGPMDSAWPMFAYDVKHTGCSPYSTINTTDTEKWRFYSSGSVDDTPIIDCNGTIYFKGAHNNLDRYLYAIYPNGAFKWKFKTGGLLWGSSPIIAEDGTIYIGSWDYKLYAIYPNGTEKWQFNSGGSISSSPTIDDDGTIYFGTLNNMIYAVNPDGTEKWHYTTGYKVSSDPAIGEDGTVYIGSADDYLYALWPNGALRWRFKTGDWIKGHPSIAEDGTIYIGSFDGYLYALYTNGTMKWRCGIGPGTETNPSIGNDDIIYVGSDNLYAIYPNGTLKWSFNMGPDRFIHKSSPAISSDETLYFGTNIDDGKGGEIIAVNPDGTEKWRKRISNKGIDSSPSIAKDGTVYIGSWYDMGEGYLHAFGTIEDNEPPSTPVITGETNGNAGESYTYTFVSNDPENYPLKYYVDWGDDTNTGWTWEYDSGEEVTFSHTWIEEGTYTILTKAMDISNDESEWGTLKVTMPRNKIIVSPLILRFLEQLPLLERLLNLF